jgi:hypothetical protein
MIYSFEELKDRANQRFQNGTLVKTQDEYQLDQAELNRWRDTYANLCDNENENITIMAYIFAECASYISFDEFQRYLFKGYTRFLKENGKKDYIMYFQNENKSNFWVTLLLIYYSDSFGESYKKPSYITNDIAEFNNISRSDGKSIEDYVVLYCDDASFSGEQICDIIRKLYYDAGKKLNIEVVILTSAMTKLAERLIRDLFNRLKTSKSIGVYYEFTLKTIPRILEEKQNNPDISLAEKAKLQKWSSIVRNNVMMDNILRKYFTDFTTYLPGNGNDYSYNILINIPVYFEHKLPDFASSFPSLFAGYVTQKCGNNNNKFNIIKNCKLSEKSKEKYALEGSNVDDECATPFYKLKISQSGGKNNKKLKKKKKTIYVI